MPYAATWMDLNIVILHKSDRKGETTHDILYMWDLKKKYK